MADNTDIISSTDGAWIWGQVVSAIESSIKSCERFKAGLARLTELKYPIPDKDPTRPWMKHVRAVAEGKLLPELFLTLAANASAVRAVGRLPPSEQEKLVKGPPLKVLGPNGKVEEKSVGDLSGKELVQVLDGTGVRSIEKQQEYLKAKGQSSIAVERARRHLEQFRVSAIEAGAKPSDIDGPLTTLRKVLDKCSRARARATSSAR